jgi:hypothetical protein
MACTAVYVSCAALRCVDLPASLLDSMRFQLWEDLDAANEDGKTAEFCK